MAKGRKAAKPSRFASHEATGRTPEVVILCGGLVTLLSEETALGPKPTAEIGGQPIL